MSAQDAKRRRADSTAAALSRPFRSPFRATAVKSNIESQEQLGSSGGTQLNQTASPRKVSNVPRARNPPPFPYKRHQGVSLSSRSSDTSISHLETVSLVNAQQKLKNKLHCLTEELSLAEQAHKIEHDLSETGSDGNEMNGDLLHLTEKWKSASRQAAEELFGGAKDRINRYAMQSKYQAHTQIMIK